MFSLLEKISGILPQLQCFLPSRQFYRSQTGKILSFLQLVSASTAVQFACSAAVGVIWRVSDYPHSLSIAEPNVTVLLNTREILVQISALRPVVLTENFGDFSQ